MRTAQGRWSRSMSMGSPLLVAERTVEVVVANPPKAVPSGGPVIAEIRRGRPSQRLVVQLGGSEVTTCLPTDSAEPCVSSVSTPSPFHVLPQRAYGGLPTDSTNCSITELST